MELPKISNIVSTADFGNNIDLDLLKNNLENVKYNPRKFKAAIFRINEPKCTFLLWRTGKIVCLGEFFLKILILKFRH